jgi:cytochrome c oxidase subunit IV
MLCRLAGASEEETATQSYGVTSARPHFTPGTGTLLLSDALRRRVGTLVWAGLVLLFAATLTAAYASLGALGTAINLAIAGVQVMLIVTFFMNLQASSALLRLAAAAGIFWLSIMFVLTFSDYTSRPPSSPCDGVGTQFVTGAARQCESAVP